MSFCRYVRDSPQFRYPASHVQIMLNEAKGLPNVPKPERVVMCLMGKIHEVL